MVQAVSPQIPDPRSLTFRVCKCETTKYIIQSQSGTFEEMRSEWDESNCAPEKNRCHISYFQKPSIITQVGFLFPAICAGWIIAKSDDSLILSPSSCFSLPTSSFQYSIFQRKRMYTSPRKSEFLKVHAIAHS